MCSWGGVPRVVTCGHEGYLGVEPGRGCAEAGCPGSCVPPPVPDGDDKVRVPDGQGAGEVDGVRAAQRVGAGEVAGVPFYGRGDDVLPPWHPRCVLIRGQAEALPDAVGQDGQPAGPIIRLHPTEVISWGLEFAEE